MKQVLIAAATESSCEPLSWPEAFVLVGLMAMMVLIVRYLFS